MATTPSGEPSRASESGPSKSTTSAEHMVRATRDAQIIELRIDGHTYVKIGSLLGVPKSTVADAIKRWLEANGPCAEQVEELRQFQGAQLDAYQAELAPHRMRKPRNEDGEIVYDGNGDDRKPIETPDVQVGQLWLRVLERRARLYGLDLERSAAVAGAVTAEKLAELFRLDEPQEAIDVDAEELPHDARAIEPGVRRLTPSSWPSASTKASAMNRTTNSQTPRGSSRPSKRLQVNYPPVLRSLRPVDASCALTCAGRSGVRPRRRRPIADSRLRCRSPRLHRQIRVRGFLRGSGLTRYDAL
jgi:hypothetical protein